MSLARAIHAPEDEAFERMPANVEAEQALLGVVLYDNAAYERVGDYLRAEHFYEPFHQRLWARIEETLKRNELADPMLMAERFEKDPGFGQLGGVPYLAELIDRAPPVPNAGDYARAVYECAVRRRLIGFSQEVGAMARDADADLTAREQVEAAEAELYNMVEAGATQQGFQTFAHYITGAVSMAAEAYSRDGGLAGLSTGLIDLDRKTGGLHPTNLIILAARPSMGKTALACNIAFDVARNYAYEVQPDGTRKTVRGGIVGFFSAEMSGEELALRILGEASGVSSDRLRRGDVDASEFGRVRDAALEIQEAPLHIDATGGLTMSKLAARARRMKRRHGLDLIVVDYLQLLVADRSRNGANRVEQLTEITVGLKALAKDLGVPVLALSQLSRQVENREDKKPQLSDLRESGSIEQDADVVMFIYREEYYLSRLEPREGTPEHAEWREKMDAAAGRADLIIGKQRHGPIGIVPVSFNETLTKFGNLARDYERAFDPSAQRIPFKDE
ncbi:hypothetical protein [Synechococcus phage Ssp-JY42]|nr:replicative DNA helicase [Synechococcus phage Yong-M4-211]